MSAAPVGDSAVARRFDDIAALLGNRQWVRRTEPFAHVYADNVFTGEFAAELEQQFRTLGDDDPAALAPNMGAYDASGSALSSSTDGPLGIFVSRAWHDLIAGVMGVQATGEVNISLHHHRPGGASGWPHNDLNPGWFGGASPASGEVRTSNDSAVHYQHGTGGEPGEARERVRAVSLLYYLGNPPWQPGEGGETALYRTLNARTPSATIPPLNNSLVAFTCTPYSFHGYLRSERNVRNSVIMWLHQPKTDVEQRWGADSIVGW